MKYKIKYCPGDMFPYVTIVEDEDYNWDLEVSMTLWGARRKIKRLKRNVEHTKRIVEEGEC